MGIGTKGAFGSPDIGLNKQLCKQVNTVGCSVYTVCCSRGLMGWPFPFVSKDIGNSCWYQVKPIVTWIFGALPEFPEQIPCILLILSASKFNYYYWSMQSLYISRSLNELNIQICVVYLKKCVTVNYCEYFNQTNLGVLLSFLLFLS